MENKETSLMNDKETPAGPQWDHCNLINIIRKQCKTRKWALDVHNFQ